MKKKTTIERCYEYNKKVFHNYSWLPNKRQLHHSLGRIGIFKCCPHFFQPVTIEQHNNWKYLEELREMYREDGLKCLRNYSKETGCKDNIFRECSICAVMLDKESVCIK